MGKPIQDTAITLCACVAFIACSVWFYLVGYSSSFEGSAKILILGISPERMLFFLAVITAGVLMALLRRRVQRNSNLISAIVYTLLLMGTLVFGLAGYQVLVNATVLACITTVLMGFGYGWTLTILWLMLVRFDSLWRIAVVVVGSSALALLILAAIHYFTDDAAQVILSVLMVLLLIACILVLQRKLAVWGASKEKMVQAAAQPSVVPVAQGEYPSLNNEQRYHLLQLMAMCIIVIALRDTNSGGLWGGVRGDLQIVDLAAFAPTLATAALFLAVSLFMFRFHTRSERNQRLQLPYLLLVALFLALSLLQTNFGSTLSYTVFSSATEYISLAIFSFTIASTARRLPYPPLLTIGAAVAFNHLIALVWMVFFEDIGLMASFVFSCLCYLLVLLMAFMGWKGIIKGANTTSESNDIYASLLHRCKELADDKGLTQRETEVLILLAQGRSMPFIQSELHLSEGTVKTHVKHIYAKLDIHTKQELLDFMGAPLRQA